MSCIYNSTLKTSILDFISQKMIRKKSGRKKKRKEEEKNFLFKMWVDRVDLKDFHFCSHYHT